MLKLQAIKRGEKRWETATVFELDIEHREITEKLKYEDYVVAECMNESDKFVQLIAERVYACTI